MSTLLASRHFICLENFYTSYHLPSLLFHILLCVCACMLAWVCESTLHLVDTSILLLLLLLCAHKCKLCLYYLCRTFKTSLCLPCLLVCFPSFMGLIHGLSYRPQYVNSNLLGACECQVLPGSTFHPGAQDLDSFGNSYGLRNIRILREKMWILV